MLTRTQVEKLEIAENLLEEVLEENVLLGSPAPINKSLNDSLQGVEDILNAYYPEGYTPPKSVKHLRVARPWHEKLKDRMFVTLGDITGLLVIISALSACASLTCWGISDIKGSLGHKQQPDFATLTETYKGLAIASIGAALGCGVVGSVIKGDK